MKIRMVENLEEFTRLLGLPRVGTILEDDLDVVEVDTDAHGRKRRDAEVLCTLAANSKSDVLELGTSQGRGAFKLATNLSTGLQCHTVNILPEQYDSSGGKMITHLIGKEDIGSFYRERGIKNILQYYANTARWELPNDIKDLGMVFVDAAHDEENVYLDSKLVWDRIAPGGFLVWHDFAPFCRHFDWIAASMRGAERFVRDLGLEALETVNLRNSWCGVLRKPNPRTLEITRDSRIQIGENVIQRESVVHESLSRVRPLPDGVVKSPLEVGTKLGSACPPSEALRKLRYAIVYPAYSAARVAEETHLAARLGHLGFNVEALPIPCEGGWWHFPKLDHKWRHQSADLMSRYGVLEERLRGKDVLIAAGGSMLHPEFIRQLSTFNVFVCADDPESSSVLSAPVAAAFDFCCVANIACVQDYAKWGVQNAAWLPLPVSEDIVDRTITEERLRIATRNVDLVMCCERIYGLSDRAQRLERLQRDFPQAILRGKGWPGGYIPDAEIRSLYRKAKIGWNLHNSIGPVNSRTMMLPAFGVLQICDCRDNLAKVFKLGKEVIGFETMDECVDATRYYLAHEDECRQIAIAGWQRVLTDYTEEKWWYRLLNHIAPHVSAQFPALTMRVFNG
jgi:predicted O-methyltransferase YrrM